MESYMQAMRILPEPLRTAALAVCGQTKQKAQELRLRVGRAPTLVLPEGEYPVPDAPEVTGEALGQVLEIASRWSLHTVLEQLRQGYLTVEGGHRLGLCGTAVLEGERIHMLRDLSGGNLRIARAHKGVAKPIVRQLFRDGQLCNTLILAPPGAGKTTLLRDLIRCLSDGEGVPPMRVAVADERGELAAVFRGSAQMDLGRSTDVMDNCPKSIAIPMLLRGMNPQVIAVDEITAREDIFAMEQAIGCGVTLLATAHGCNLEDLKRRPVYRELMDKGVFQRLIILRVEGGMRHTELVDMEAQR